MPDNDTGVVIRKSVYSQFDRKSRMIQIQGDQGRRFSGLPRALGNTEDGLASAFRKGNTFLPVRQSLIRFTTLFIKLHEIFYNRQNIISIKISKLYYKFPNMKFILDK